MLYCGIQYVSRSFSWTLIQKHSPSDFEVLRTQINPISRTDISHKSCADFVLPCMRIMRIFSVPSKVCLRTLNFNRRSPTVSDDHLPSNASSGSDFKPRSPWGERQPYMAHIAKYSNFNPRSPWGATGTNSPVEVVTLFQSTLPVRGATHLRAGCSSWRVFQSTLPVRERLWPTRRRRSA